MTSKTILVALAVVCAVSGCAALQRQGALQNERMLAAAGFQMKFATTPPLSTQAAGLPQRKLVAIRSGDGVRYVYADSKYCNCIYAGTEQAYDRYQRLVLQSDIAAENAEILTAEDEADADWGAWGPWGPWY